ncbi:MAG: RNA 3'-terminal phosphate cyclase, partial [Candidatus Geothermarchaeales archaeon]
IDGSFGEGGGQILRYASTLATVLGKTTVVKNIRAKRSNPGLRPQHLAGLKTISQVSGSSVEGLAIGSSTIRISPGVPEGGVYACDIGTAGSIPLIVQSILPVLLFATRRSVVSITGGTDVRWSPTSDYQHYVLLPTLKAFGIEARLKVVKRGYYPWGGGRATLEVEPCDFLKAVRIEREDVASAQILSVGSNLPRHVAERQYMSAKKVLEEEGLEDISGKAETLGRPQAVGRGSSVLVHSIQASGGASGGDSIGERGKPAERVGREAAKKYLVWFGSEASVDPHLGDMLIPFCCLARGSSEFSVPSLTGHMRTALHVQERISGSPYALEEDEGRAILRIEGRGFRSVPDH